MLGVGAFLLWGDSGWLRGTLLDKFKITYQFILHFVLNKLCGLASTLSGGLGSIDGQLIKFISG